MLRKLIQGSDAAKQFERLPRPLVFTNGVFDILHRGHVAYLSGARELGAALLVAINSDSSVRLLAKASGRPINAQDDRAFVLEGLQCVSAVTLFDEPTPVAKLRMARPDIYVKGGDYDIELLEETQVVRSWGGRALALPYVAGHSTTSLVARIRSQL